MKACTFRTRRTVKLTVYFRAGDGIRETSGAYSRSEAALRLKWARHHEDFKGYAITREARS